MYKLRVNFLIFLVYVAKDELFIFLKKLYDFANFKDGQLSTSIHIVMSANPRATLIVCLPDQSKYQETIYLHLKMRFSKINVHVSR